MSFFRPSLLRRRKARLAKKTRLQSFRPGLEQLEERSMLATFAEAATNLNLSLDVASQSLGVVSGGTTYSLTLTGGDLWLGADSANVTGNGTAVLTVETAGLAAFDTINITDAAAGSAVNFNDSGANAYSDHFNVTLDDALASTIAFNGATSFSGANALLASTTRNIAVNSGASVTTVNGNLTLSANQQVAPTAGNFIGIDVNNATVSTTGTGDIALLGRGGDDAGTGAHFGVEVHAAGAVTSTSTAAGAGTITITGTAGQGNSSDAGVVVFNTNSKISTDQGDILITGTAPSTTTGSSNIGVDVESGGLVTSTGTGASAGKITISGTGGGGTSLNQGVRIDGNGLTAVVSSVDGNIQLSGAATASTGTLQDGVLLSRGGTITTTGTATVLVTGTTGTTNTAVGVGLRLGDTSLSTLSLTGATNTFVGNSMVIDTTNFTLNAGANTVVLKPNTIGTVIDLGGADTTGTLGLTNLELDQITAGTVQIGDAASSTITVSATIIQPAKNLTLITGAGVTGAFDIINGSATATTLTINQVGNSTYSGKIGGPAGGTANDKNLAFTKTGVGKLTLSGANTYTGATLVSQGVLNIQNNSALGATGAAAGTTVSAGAALELEGGVTTIGETLTLNGSGVGVTGALRNIGDTNRSWNGPITLASNVTIGGTAGAGNELTLDGAIGETGGARNLDVVGAGYSFVMTVANTYTGTTTVLGSGSTLRLRNAGTKIQGPLVIGDGSTGGTMHLDASEQIADTSDVTVNSDGLLALGPFGSVTETIDELIGGGFVEGSAGQPDTLVVGANGGSNTFSGTIRNGSGTVALTKTGAGTQTLSGPNTYTGATTINTGTLLVNGSTAAGSAVAVNNAAILGGTGTVGGTVNANNTSHIAPGTSPGILDSGSVTFASTSNFDVELGSTTPGDGAGFHDQLNVTGTVTLGGATLNVGSFGGFVPAAGDEFIIINNDSNDAVTGTFTGGTGTVGGALAEGAVVSANFLASGKTARITYKGGNGNDVALIVDGPATFAGSGNLTLRLNVDKIEFLDDGVVVRTRSLASLAGSKITVNGADATNDTLTVDYATGGSFNVDIDFNGGVGGADTLALVGGTTTSQTFNFTNEHDGSIVLAGAIAATINYTGLEPVTSTINATDVILNYSDVAETITVSAAGAQTKVDSDVGGETNTFNNPTGTLQIFAGTAADAADDVITLVGFGTGFAAAVTINGRGGSDTLTGMDIVNAWAITGANAGTLNTTTTFSNIETLNGGTGNDTFTLGAGVASFVGTITGGGGAGTDALTATDGVNAWAITGANAGSLNATTLFSGIETLNGGTGNDTFTLGAGVASFVGTITGGGGAGTDALTATDGVNAWAITGANAGSLNATTLFSGIETLNGGTGNDTFTLGAGVASFVGTITGGGGGDILTATDGANAWAISAANAGTLNATTTFSSIETLNGGTGVDTFTLAAGVASFIGTITGGGSGDILTATDGANAWAISAANAGTLNATTTFSSIENLNGGTGVDTFTLAAGVASFIGTITGGGSGDILTATDGANAWAISAANAGTLNATTTFSSIETLNGGTGVDTFTLAAGVASFIGTITGGGSGDILTATDGANAWAISAANAGTLNATTTFSSIETLNGGTGVDTFILAAGVASFIGTITGGGSSDILTATDGANAWAISAANAGTLNATTTFSSIETLNGGTGVDTFTLAAGVASFIGTITGGGSGDILTATDGANAWAISAANAGTLNATTTFSSIETLNGGTGVDTFTLAAGVASFIGTITGGGSSDILTATDGANAWAISAANAGTLNATTTFSSIETLNGGTGVDTFTLAAGVASFIGTITGGGSGDILTATDGANAWAISAANAGTLNATTTFSSIETLNGGTGVDTFTLAAGVASFIGTITGGGSGDILTATDGANAWAISAANAGTLNATTTFSSIETLNGGTGVDTFILAAGVASFIGTITGGGSSDILTATDGANAWAISAANAGTLNATTTFSSIETLNGGTGVDTFTLAAGVASFIGTITGGGSGDILTATDGANAWAITGANAGTLNATTTFSSIENLNGGTGVDTFTLAAGVASFIGTITGGGSGDILTATDGANAWAISAANAGTLNATTTFSSIETLNGGTGVDTFTLAAGVASFIGTITGGGSSDILTATDGANAWAITGANAGSLNATTIFSTIETLQGGTGVDTFTFSGAASFTGSARGGAANDTFNVDANTGTLSLFGEADNDTFNIATGNLNTVQGTLSINGGGDTALTRTIQTSVNGVTPYTGITITRTRGDTANFNDIAVPVGIHNRYTVSTTNTAGLGTLAVTSLNAVRTFAAASFTGVELVNLVEGLDNDKVIVTVPAAATAEAAGGSLLTMLTLDGGGGADNTAVFNGDGATNHIVVGNLLAVPNEADRSVYEVRNVSRFSAHGAAGDDVIQNRTALPALLDGDNGADLLVSFATAANNVLLGGAGADVLASNGNGSFMLPDQALAGGTVVLAGDSGDVIDSAGNNQSIVSFGVDTITISGAGTTTIADGGTIFNGILAWLNARVTANVDGVVPAATLAAIQAAVNALLAPPAGFLAGDPPLGTLLDNATLDGTGANGHPLLRDIDLAALGGHEIFSFTLKNRSILKIDAVYTPQANDDVKILLFDSDLKLLAMSSPTTAASGFTGQELTFASVPAGEVHYFSVVGTNTSVDVRVQNTVTVNSPLTVHGTSGDDVFEYWGGSAYQFAMNGVRYAFDSSHYESATFLGNGGHDTLIVHTAADADAVLKGADFIDVMGAGYEMHGRGIKTITVAGPAPFVAPPKQNVDNPLDVNADGTFNVADIFALIGVLRAVGPQQISLGGTVGSEEGEAAPSTFADVNGDNYINVADAFALIGAYRSGRAIAPAPQGEGEAAFGAFAPLVATAVATPVPSVSAAFTASPNPAVAAVVEDQTSLAPVSAKSPTDAPAGDRFLPAESASPSATVVGHNRLAAASGTAGSLTWQTESLPAAAFSARELIFAAFNERVQRVKAQAESATEQAWEATLDEALLDGLAHDVSSRW